MKEQLIELLKSPENIELAFILGEGQNLDMCTIVNKVYPIDFLKELGYLKKTTLLEQVKESLQLNNIDIETTKYPKEIFNLKCTKYFYNDYGHLHRQDGPAVEYSDGDKHWYLNGQYHREDGPAIEDSNGYKEWWINGQLHREDGPAIEYIDGSKEWYLNGQLHREDGPAYEGSDGHKEWYLNGKRHREDGPAVIYRDGTIYYYLNGKELSEDEFKRLKT